MEINFQSVRQGVGKAKLVSPMDVCRFKDDEAGPSKVIADSERFVVYSLKKPQHLRVLVKSEAPPLQIAFKNHTTAVRQAKFVNDVSNIIASASDTEIIAWFIRDSTITSSSSGAAAGAGGGPSSPTENTGPTRFVATIYFSMPVCAHGFSWIPLRDKPPDLLLLFRESLTSDTCTAAVLKSSSLILSSGGADSQSAALPDGSLVARASDLNKLAISLPPTARHTAVANPTMVFSFDAEHVVTCTVSNPSTPKWKPCGELGPIVDLALLPTETLCVASASHFFLWDVAGEPRPLQTLALGTMGRCTTVKCQPQSAYLFYGGNDAASSEVAVLKIPYRQAASAVSFFQLNTAVVPPASVSVIEKGDDRALLLIDLGKTVSYVELDSASASSAGAPRGFQAALGSPPSAAPPAASNTAEVKPTKRDRRAPDGMPKQSPPLTHASPAGPPPPYVITQPAASAAGGAARPPPAVAFPMASFLPSAVAASPPPPTFAVGAAHPPPSIPVVAAAVSVPASPTPAPPANLDAIRAPVDECIVQAHSALTAAQTSIARDHEKAVQQALDAQAAVTQKAVAEAVRALTASQAAGGDPDAAVQAALNVMAPLLANAIVDSVSAGIEEHINTQLEVAIRQCMSKVQAKASRPSADLKDRVDAVVKDAMVNATTEVEKRHNAFSARLMHYIYDLSAESMQAVQELQVVVQQQQQQLDAITKSGILEEVEQLRAQVASMRAEIERGGTTVAPTPAVPLNAETVIANAKRLIVSGDHDAGLQWILRLDDVAALLKLLGDLDDDQREAMVTDRQINEVTWTRLVHELTATPKLENVTITTSWLVEILASHPEYSRNTQLKERVNTFLLTWKAATLPSEARERLRELAMVTREKK